MELTSARVLVTPTSFRTADPAILHLLEERCASVTYNESGRPYTAAELRSALADVDGYIAGLDQASEEALSGANKLKIIARYGVGTDNVDLAFAREHGIVVTNTPGANAVSVAELTVGLMLSLLRRIPQAAAETKLGSWPRTSGMSLKGKTVGIIGLGAVGREVARRLRPFECQMIGYDPWVSASDLDIGGLRDRKIHDLLAESDIVTLHIPGSPETRGMVNRGFFEHMKQNAFLINTSRGELVDEISLLEALKSGRLAGAALDVFATEPPSRENEVLQLPNVIATPHMAAHTDDAVNAMARMAVDDCLAVLQGHRPRHRVV